MMGAQGCRLAVANQLGDSMLQVVSGTYRRRRSRAVREGKGKEKMCSAQCDVCIIS